MQYLQSGWPKEAVLNYLYNIVAAGFEEEKLKKPDTTIWNYPLRIKKIPTSSALFGFEKLQWWAREYIATMSVSDLVQSVVDWANVYGSDDNKKQVADIDYLTAILSIERDNPKRIRKDFITWQQTLSEIAPFFDFLFEPNREYEYRGDVLREFLATFDESDDKDTWWNKIVSVAEKFGIKPGEVAMNLRVAVLGRTNTPDLYSVIKVMGGARMAQRINMII